MYKVLTEIQMWEQVESEKMYKDFQRKHQLSDQALEDVMARVRVKSMDVHLIARESKQIAGEHERLSHQMGQLGGYGVS